MKQLVQKLEFLKPSTIVARWLPLLVECISQYRFLLRSISAHFSLPPGYVGRALEIAAETQGPLDLVSSKRPRLILPILSIVVCLSFDQYSLSTWLAFGVALLIGVGIYFGYGYRHSEENQ